MIVKPSLTIAQGLEHRAEGPKMTFKSYEDYDGGQMFKDEITGKVVRSIKYIKLVVLVLVNRQAAPCSQWCKSIGGKIFLIKYPLNHRLMVGGVWYCPVPRVGKQR